MPKITRIFSDIETNAALLYISILKQMRRNYAFQKLFS